MSNSTIDQMYAYFSGYRLTRAPGSTFEYSNFGFGLLGNLLARIAGQADYEAILLDRITRPLGMDSTRIVLTSDMESRLAAPHMSYSVLTSNWNAPAFAGAGMIRSTANDLLTFLAANMGMTETELRPALQLANAPQRPSGGSGYIGLAWGVPETGQGMQQHSGQTSGYYSFLVWDSERNIGVVVLANASVSIDDIGLFLMTESAKLVDTIHQKKSLSQMSLRRQTLNLLHQLGLLHS